MVADGKGGLAIAGEFSGALRIGDREVASAGGTDVFVARLDAAGATRFLHALGGAGDDRASAVAFAPGGDAVVVGQSDGRCFVARLAGDDGRERYLVRLEGKGESNCRAVAIDGHGDVWTTGYFSGSLGKASAKGQYDLFVARLSGADGSVQWTAAYGGLGKELPRAIAVRPSGEVLVAGQFAGEAPVEKSEVNFGLGPVRSHGDFDAFLLSLDRDGKTRWVTTFGENGDDEINALLLGAAGEIYVSGHLQPEGEYGGRSAHEIGNFTGFVAQFDAAGKRQWLQPFAGASSSANAITLDDEGRLWATGPFQGALRVSGLTLPNAGGYDVFAIAFDPRAGGAPLVAKSFGSPAMDIGRGVARIAGGVALAGFTRGELVACGRPIGSGGQTGFLLQLREGEVR